MRKFIFIISIFTCIGLGACAQPPAEINRLEALHTAYLTQQLNLNAEEARRFWPLYNSYTFELRQARAVQGGDVIGSDEKILTIRKKYRESFRKILVTEDRVNRLYFAERDFGNILRKEFQRRQMKRRGPY